MRCQRNTHYNAGMNTPLPQKERNRRYRETQRRAGAVSMPSGLLPPDAGQALQWLVDNGYARNKTEAVSIALLHLKNHLETSGIK